MLCFGIWSLTYFDVNFETIHLFSYTNCILTLQGFVATGTPIHSRLTALYNFERSESLSYFPRIDIQQNDTNVTDLLQRQTSAAMMTTSPPIATSMAIMTANATTGQAISPSLALCELGEYKRNDIA